MNRRNFLRLGALFVPAAIVEPRRVYSFIWAPPTRVIDVTQFGEWLRLCIAADIAAAKLNQTLRFAALKRIVIEGTVSI